MTDTIQMPKPGDITRLVMARKALRTIAKEFHTCQFSSAKCPGCYAAQYVREMRAHEQRERESLIKSALPTGNQNHEIAGLSRDKIFDQHDRDEVVQNYANDL